MGRLIDADELIKRLWEQHKGIQANADMYTNADEVAEEVCYLVSFIDEQPTAYDVDKVEQQIEEMFGVDATYYGTEAKWAVEKAREIVRKGCVKNDNRKGKYEDRRYS